MLMFLFSGLSLHRLKKVIDKKISKEEQKEQKEKRDISVG